METSGLGIEPSTLVGFENHAGRTYLGEGLVPLGRCLVGAGNNGDDGVEGVREGRLVGTYLHGSLLPKNPHLTDLLIRWGLERRHGDIELSRLPADEELEAHLAMAARIRREGPLGPR